MSKIRRQVQVGSLIITAALMFAIVAAAAVTPPKWAAALFIEQKKVIGLRWAPTRGASEYVILRSETQGSGYQEIGRAKTPSYLDSGIEEGSTYYYVLQAVVGGETSPQSDERAVTYPGVKKVAFVPPPWAKEPEIQEKVLFGKSVFNIGLFWKKSANPSIVNYNVYRKKEGEIDYFLLTSVGPSVTQYLDQKVPTGTFSYVLTATNDMFEETAYSEEKTVVIAHVEREAEKKKVALPNPTLRVEPSKQINRIVSSEELKLGGGADLAVDSDGNYYLADVASASIKIFNASGDYVGEFGNTGENVAKLHVPLGLAIDGDDNVYVADRALPTRIVVYNKGSFAREMISPPLSERLAKLFTAKVDPLFKDVAVNSKGFVYAIDNSAARVVVFDPNGKFVKEFGEPGTEPGQLNAPGWAIFNDKDELHICNGLNRRIEVFDSDGNYLRQYGISKSFVGSFLGPTGITFDDKGNAIVSDAAMSTIQYFDPEGTYQFHIGNEKGDMDTDSKQRARWDVRNPAGVVFNGQTGQIAFTMSLDKAFEIRELIK